MAAARKPKAPALQAAATSSGVATQPIPVCKIGTSQPSSSVTRVFSGLGMGGSFVNGALSVATAGPWNGPS